MYTCGQGTFTCIKFYWQFVIIINVCIYNVPVHYTANSITNTVYVNMQNALYNIISIELVVSIGLYLLLFIDYRNIG